MRLRLIFGAFLGLLAGVCHAACDPTLLPLYTSRAGLQKPSVNSCTWGSATNANWNIVDSSGMFLSATNNFTGVLNFNGGGGPIFQNANGNGVSTIFNNGQNGKSELDIRGADGVGINTSNEMNSLRGFVDLAIKEGTTLDGTTNMGRFAVIGSSQDGTMAYTGFRSTNPITTSTLWALPHADGTNGQALVTDGSANLSFATIIGGGGGGSSALEMLFGAARSSPTATLNGYKGDFIGNVVGSTMTFILNPATTDFIQNNPGSAQVATATIAGPFNTNSYFQVNGQPFLTDGGTSFGQSIFAGAQAVISGGKSNDTCMGYQACQSITNGQNDTMIGHVAGQSLTSGQHNTCMGHSACQSITTSSHNTGIGSNALFNILGGSDNTTVGYLAGNNITGGSQNTVVGSQAGIGISSGTYNTVIGGGAGAAVTIGTKNIIISGGTTSQGSAITTGSSNTIVGNGDGSGFTDNSNNQGVTYLGFDAGPGTASQLINATAIGFNSAVASSNTIQMGGTGTNAVVTNMSSATISGPGNGVIIETIGVGTVAPSTYTVTSSSTTPTAGHCVAWGSTNYTLIDVGSNCGGGSATPGGNNRDVQFNNNGLLGGDTNFFITGASMTYQNRAIFAYQPGDDLSLDTAQDQMIVMMRSTSDRFNLQMTGTGNFATFVMTDPSGYPRNFSTSYQGGSGANLFTNNLSHDVSMAAPAINNSQRLLFGVGSSSATVMLDTSTHVNFEGPSPALTSCGTGPLENVGCSDNACTITPGSTASGCTVTFAKPFLNPPTCTVGQQTFSLANALTYTVTKSALTITQTSLTSKLDVICIGKD